MKTTAIIMLLVDAVAFIAVGFGVAGCLSDLADGSRHGFFGPDFTRMILGALLILMAVTSVNAAADLRAIRGRPAGWALPTALAVGNGLLFMFFAAMGGSGLIFVLISAYYLAHLVFAFVLLRPAFRRSSGAGRPEDRP